MRKRILEGLGRASLALGLLLGASAVASGSVTTQITGNSTDDYSPAISGSKVVWDGYDGDAEIYLMTGVVPQPASAVPALSPPALALLAGLPLGVGAWVDRRRRLASA